MGYRIKHTTRENQQEVRTSKHTQKNKKKEPEASPLPLST